MLAPQLNDIPTDKLKLALDHLGEERQRLIAENSLAYYRPYPKQQQFHSAGATYRERLLMAANQSGKTLAGGMEAAMHATGRYPEWWRGRRFDRPTVAWVAGETAETIRWHRLTSACVLNLPACREWRPRCGIEGQGGDHHDSHTIQALMSRPAITARRELRRPELGTRSVYFVVRRLHNEKHVIDRELVPRLATSQVLCAALPSRETVIASAR
jgi:hypothetical protein